MELQIGFLAVLAIIGFGALGIAIVGRVPKMDDRLEKNQRVIIGILSLLPLGLMLLILFNMGLIPKPIKKNTPVQDVLSSSEDVTSIGAVHHVDTYYRTINEAENEVDLETAYYYQSPSLRGLWHVEDYTAFWLSVYTEYSIYDCGDNIAEVKLIYFNRYNNKATGREQMIRHTIETYENGDWSIINSEEINETNCVLWIFE